MEEIIFLLGTSAMSADVLIPNLKGDKDTAFDVTMVSPLLTNRVELFISLSGYMDPSSITSARTTCRHVRKRP